MILLCYTRFIATTKQKQNGKMNVAAKCVFSGNNSQTEGVAILVNPKSGINIENVWELKVGLADHHSYTVG